MPAEQSRNRRAANAARRKAPIFLGLSQACLLGLLVLLPATGRAQDLDLAALKRQSQLVFVGTIQSVGAATEANVPVDDRTAIVRVDRVLRSVKQFQALKGRDVTVQLRPELPAVAGESAVFFTRSWLYGKSVAVVEVGRGDASQEKALASQIEETEVKVADEKLAGRLATAELIVYGTVTRVQPAPEEKGRGPITEHDPDWWEATIAVRSVEKGQFPPELKVRFAHSLDEMWIDSPKLRKGMTAVFLLRQDQQEKGMPALRRSGWTALDPLDVQPPARIAHLRALLKAQR
jgi:hypothetical protein